LAKQKAPLQKKQQKQKHLETTTQKREAPTSLSLIFLIINIDFVIQTKIDSDTTSKKGASGMWEERTASKDSHHVQSSCCCWECSSCLICSIAQASQFDPVGGKPFVLTSIGCWLAFGKWSNWWLRTTCGNFFFVKKKKNKKQLISP